jgi:hypothetical protein
MVLGRIFGPKRNEVTGGCKGLHNEELFNLYSLPSIVKTIKSKMIGSSGNAAPAVKEELIENFSGKTRKEKITRKT